MHLVYAGFVVAKSIAGASIVTFLCAACASAETPAEAPSGARDEPPASSVVDRQPEMRDPAGDVTAPAVDLGAVPVAAITEKPLLSWSFEPASADCNGWPVLGAEAIRAVPPRSGSYACKLCANGSAPSVTIAKDVGTAPPGRYAFRAWVRKRVGSVAPPAVSAEVEAETTGGLVQALSTPVALGEEWAELSAAVELGAGATRLTVRINADAADGCLLVDDVSLTRAP
jgi:hypothetical protein